MPLIFDMGLEPFLSGDTSNPLLNPGILRSVLAERRQVLRDIEDREFRKRMADFQEKMARRGHRLRKKQVDLDAQRVGFEGKRLDLEEDKFGLAKQQFEQGQLRQQALSQLSGQLLQQRGVNPGNVDTSNLPFDAVIKFLESDGKIRAEASEQAQYQITLQRVDSYLNGLVERGVMPREVADQYSLAVANGEMTVAQMLAATQEYETAKQERDNLTQVSQGLRETLSPRLEGHPDLQQELEMLLNLVELDGRLTNQIMDGVTNILDKAVERERKNVLAQMYEDMGIPSEQAGMFASLEITPVQALQSVHGKNLEQVLIERPEITLQVVKFIDGQIGVLEKELRQFQPGGVNSELLIKESGLRGRQLQEALQWSRERREEIENKLNDLRKQRDTIMGSLSKGIVDVFENGAPNAIKLPSSAAQSKSPEEVEPEATSTGFVVNKRGDTFYVETPNDGKANGSWRINRVPGTMDDAMAIAMKIRGKDAPQEELIELAKVIWSATR